MKLLYLILIALSICYCASSFRIENGPDEIEHIIKTRSAEPGSFMSLTTNNVIKDAAEYKKRMDENRRRGPKGQIVFNKDTYQKRQRY